MGFPPQARKREWRAQDRDETFPPRPRSPACWTHLLFGLWHPSRCAPPPPQALAAPLLFSFFFLQVVNTQYFTGILTERETVRLERDPANIYDKTAIRVMNVMGTEVA